MYYFLFQILNDLIYIMSFFVGVKHVSCKIWHGQVSDM